MTVMPTTEPETIRAALAAQLQTVIPRLGWQSRGRWTWQEDGEISGTLRNFDLIFGAEYEVTVDDRGVQGAYGGGIEYASDVIARVSYPVKRAELPRYLGADCRDLTAVLVQLHQTVPGMFAQEFNRSDRVVPTFEGDDGAYIGEFAFTIRFFADASVETEP